MGSYLRLVLDHAEDTVFGRRGLAMSNPQSVSAGTAWCSYAFQVVVGRDIIETHFGRDAGPLKPCVPFGTVDNFVTVTHESVGEIHIKTFILN